MFCLQDGQHADDVTLEFTHEAGEITVDLQLSVDMLPEAHFLSYQSPNDGSTVVINNFTRSTVDHCHYTVGRFFILLRYFIHVLDMDGQGSIRGRPNSRAAISTCHGVSGLLFDEHEVYHIETDKTSASSTDTHFFYR